MQEGGYGRSAEPPIPEKHISSIFTEEREELFLQGECLLEENSEL